MGNSLDTFLKDYCICEGEQYMKLSRFKNCYKGFCSDNNLTIVDINEFNFEKYGIEVITMNSSKWLKGIRLKGE